MREGRVGLGMAAITLAAIACAPASDRRPAAPSLLDAYDWDHGRRLQLPETLREVSGLVEAPDGRVLTHGDERAVLYRIDVDAGTVSGPELPFGSPAPKGDFEGIAWVDDHPVLLSSDGVLLAPGKTTDTGAGRQCELEGVTSDPARSRLLLACKQVRRGPDHGLTILTWSLPGGGLGPELRVGHKEMAEAGGDTLHASDIAIEPRSGHIVVVAARDRAIAELTADGALVAVRTLPPLHAQAEGLAFLRDGTLLIADEGRPSPAWLTVYRRRQP